LIKNTKFNNKKT